MTKPASDNLTFKTRIRQVEYGDKRTFFEYQILMMYRGKVAGIEEGPRRSAADRPSALKAARARISILRHRRLFVVRVTRKHISDGEARNCNTCAISQALWHNQERMGFPKVDFRFEVSTYGAFMAPRGIVIRERYGRDHLQLSADQIPDIAIGIFNGRPYSEGMAEWTMAWDDWAESRGISLAEWREQNGYVDGETPGRPGPCSFVLDLDAFQKAE